MGDVTEWKAGIPAALQGQLGNDNDDLSAGVRGGYSILSIRGSRFHIKQDGEEVTITDPSTGDPVGSLRVVVVKASPNISKQYYVDGYNPDAKEAPDCSSIDGITPDPGSPKVQAQSCAVCPHNVFGSRITDDGKKAKACSDSRRIAVVPEGDFANAEHGGPLLLRIPAGSLTNLAQYGKKMKSKGFPYNTILTRVSFDHKVSHPKLEFNALRPLSDDEANELVSLLGDPDFSSKIEAILATDLEVVRPAQEQAPKQEQLFEEAPDVQAKPEEPAPAPKPAEAPKAEAEAAPPAPQEAPSDESDDALDSELKDILGSLDNLD